MGPSCPEWGVAAGDDLQQSTPHFLFAGGKKKTAVEPPKEKSFSLRSYGRGTRPAAQRDAALNRSAQSTQLLREHGRGFAETSEPSAPCCTPQSSGKG